MSKQCKDCVHYEVCYELTYHEPNGEIVGREVCQYFKDKSRFVELPCKVGCDLYRIIHSKDKFGYYTDGLIIADYWQLTEIRIFHDDICFVDDSDNEFTIEDIGKTVFLTREEAEKSVEREGK